MEYSFNVLLTDQDYYEFNKFVTFQSRHGKKEIKKMRLYLVVLFAVLALLFLVLEHFSMNGVYSAVGYLVGLLIAQALFKPLMHLILKMQIKMLKKGGKMPYSPQAEMTFTEEGFSEFTSEHKTEQIYTAVECVSVVEGVAIYVHINKLMGFLLPEKVFESKQQLDEFITFLKTKVTTVDFYPIKK